MEEPVRWVTKAGAAEELEVSLSTLDRMIRRGEVEVAREEELQRTVQELEQIVSEWQQRASGLERDRDEARESAAANRPYHELEGERRGRCFGGDRGLGADSRSGGAGGVAARTA